MIGSALSLAMLLGAAPSPLGTKGIETLASPAPSQPSPQEHAPSKRPAEAASISYSRDIKPILVARCYLCHGPDVSTRKARLRLDERGEATAVRRGRAAIVPGSPEESELWIRASAEDPDERMPPIGEGHESLSDQELDLLYRWIEEGAVYEGHWSWQPLGDPPVPSVRDESWPRDDVDRFILHELENRALAPAKDADAAARLRRLHFDLTGLPPAPESVRAFLANPTEAAWNAEVDRLLADGGFGEQFGRHWLDLVRYAETHGHEFDYPIDHAWRYRDWVIAALNHDMPYDQFVREQLHGDLMPQSRTGSLIGVPAPVVATGWWSLSQGTHGPVDVRQDELDRIDNQIDVYSRTFLGSTMACARCHDHKFDAIGQDAYYAMAGVIRSSRRAYAYLDPTGQISARSAEIDALLEAVQSMVHAAAPHAAPRSMPEAALAWDFGTEDDGWDSQWSRDGWSFDAARIERGGLIASDGKATRRAETGMVHSARGAGSLQGTARSPDFRIAGTRVLVRARGAQARVRVIIDRYFLNERNALLFESMIQSIDAPEEWRTYAIDVSRYQGELAYVELVDDGPGFLAVDWIVHGESGAEIPPLPAADATLAVDKRTSSVLSAIERAAKDIPVPERALAMTDGSGSDHPVLGRGDHRAPGKAAMRSRAALSPSPPPSISGSGRIETADQLLAPDHPLTARVAVNRIWLHIMGRGLSNTPDDLGGMGEVPVHSALLDHLARDFQRDWSVKRLVRRLVLSRTYALSTIADPEHERRDPGGELHGRAQVRRITAENLRDAMLAVAGSLDRTMGGPSVAAHLTDSMQGRGRPGRNGPLDGAGRRTIYLEVRRNFLSPFLLAFDAPAPATTVGRRASSNVPAQGLILFNDPFVVEMAARFGARAVGWVFGKEDEERRTLEEMIMTAYGRPARTDEVDLLSSALHDAPGGLADIAQAILASKEFAYLR